MTANPWTSAQREKFTATIAKKQTASATGNKRCASCQQPMLNKDVRSGCVRCVACRATAVKRRKSPPPKAMPKPLESWWIAEPGQSRSEFFHRVEQEVDRMESSPIARRMTPRKSLDDMLLPAKQG